MSSQSNTVPEVRFSSAIAAQHPDALDKIGTETVVCAEMTALLNSEKRQNRRTSSPMPCGAKLRKCAKRSVVRWLPWPIVADVTLRRAKQDEPRRSLGGSGFSSTSRPLRVARCRAAYTNVLHYAVAFSGGHAEVHITSLREPRRGISMTNAQNRFADALPWDLPATLVSGATFREILLRAVSRSCCNHDGLRDRVMRTPAV